VRQSARSGSGVPIVQSSAAQLFDKPFAEIYNDESKPVGRTAGFLKIQADEPDSTATQ
jgi:hypothetical protein